MKKTWKFLLMVVVVLSLGMSVTSCKDDDDDEKTEEQKEQEAQEKADRFWDVMTQLAGVDAYTPDYEGKTFEPVIGLPDDGNPMVRIVNTGDMESAAKRFAALISENSINENTSTYEWKDNQVGTMTYHKTNNGQSWAEVEVSIKAMPRLQKIIYRSAEQSGQNGSFDGTAYYRFGDVIKRVYNDKDDNNTQKTEYWICVRPAVGAAGKEETHWVSISRPPKKNIWTYTSSQKKTYGLPTGIGKSEEHMYNFAELLYAILHPHDWGEALTSANRVHPPMWWDFKLERYKLNNEWFFQRVSNAWDKEIYEGEENLWSLLFNWNNDKKEARSEFKENFDNFGLHLLYKGYSWWTKTSWYCTLYEAIFKNGEGKKANMHDLTYRDVKADMQNILSAININEKDYDKYPYICSDGFFGDTGVPRYVIRYASGKELAGIRPNVYVSLSAAGNGITDVYTYNKTYNIQPGNLTPAEENVTEEMVQNDDPKFYKALEEPIVGCLIGKDGKFYYNWDVCDHNSTTPIAMVVYLGGNKRVEKGTDFNGLAITLSDVRNAVGTGYTIEYQKGNSQRMFCTSSTSNSNLLPRLLDGIAMTNRMANGTCGADHDHQLAKQATEFYQKNYWALNENKFSKTFVPSMGQWILALQGIGETWTGNGFTSTGKLKELYERSKAGRETSAKVPKGYYATVTENDWTQVYGIYFDNDCKAKLENNYTKHSSYNLRTFIAFKYGNGGTQDPEAMPEQHPDQPAMVGYVMTSDGKFYKNEADAKAAGKTVVAVVAYASPKSNTSTEDNTNYNALAIGLKDMVSAWCTEEFMNNAKSDRTYYTTVLTDRSKIPATLDGLSMTKKLDQLNKDKNNAPLFIAPLAKDFFDKAYPLTGNNHSGWFLPSIGQWVLAMQGYGAKWNATDFENRANAFAAIKKAFTDAGMAASAPELGKANDYYYTSTQYDYTSVWTVSETFPATFTSKLMNDPKDAIAGNHRARCFVAFKVEY